MPQADRHRERTVPIEFEECKNFSDIIQDDRVTLVLVS